MNFVRDALLLVLDVAHADAVLADRESLGVPLALEEARTIAAWCDQYRDANAAAELLVVRRYQGCRGLSPVPARAVRQQAREGSAAPHEGDICRDDEPQAFAIACDLAGWSWKAGWRQARFPITVARRARILATPSSSRLRVVGEHP